MTNRFFITLLVVIAIIVGIFAFTKQKDKNTAVDTGAKPTNHIKGEGKSGVVLTEIGDFQCSACYQYEPIIQQVVEKYKEQISFQFRHFPIVSSHPNAFSASRAAEAAAKQGKFWEMHDKLYETQDPTAQSGWVASSNPLTFFEGFAKNLGLDVAQFKIDFASEEVNNSINADIAEAKKVSVEGTPTFLIDGVKIESPRSIEDFNKLIDEAIKAKQATPSS